ncbi:ImmA/IrrE family metallo-endopeptidase [Nocardioides sp. SOB77]|uniref:ImmA/IrrE family metallo-endopeptidase n=1 Tax=Nocardioides oceani TaxID=3058369 RepID=A0ABT8FGX1_9ACTN|nr:ImmA/IrrE family metallo-endopeptidase [Nocardioides oceani]MDN4173933.1 ImmA/IrrE family metallo-endopeptidase [Nocardioides oceani]
MSVIYETQLSARSAADSVLRDLWDEDLYPVDPFKIADKLGVRVLYGDLPEDVSGMLRAQDGQVTMYIDTDESARRQRFTAAHELGHYVQRQRAGADLAKLAFIDRRSDMARRGSDTHEIYANEFAACLLMPASAVRRLHNQGWHDWEMARFFDVSPASMTYRLRNLGLER